MHRHHVLVQMIHDPQRSADHQRDDQHAERQRVFRSSFARQLHILRHHKALDVVRPVLEQRPSSGLLFSKIIKGAQLKIYKRRAARHVHDSQGRGQSSSKPRSHGLC